MRAHVGMTLARHDAKPIPEAGSSTAHWGRRNLARDPQQRSMFSVARCNSCGKLPSFDVRGRIMNDEYFKEHAARVRQIASFADPFTKKRLLDLAERYDGNKPAPRKTPLPAMSPPDNSKTAAGG
jgi:hypothetical protein